MQQLKEKILADGKVMGEDIVRVDSFLNHQIDIEFLNSIGQEFKQRFKEETVTKILTVEASGIAIACITAQYFNVPVIFAKKGQARNIEHDIYSTEVFSFTRNTAYKIMVSRSYLNTDDRVLIIDDFLANGRAVMGLIDIVSQAGANLAGVGIVIEKGFQEGGTLIRKAGVNLQSLAIIQSIDKGKIVFR